MVRILVLASIIDALLMFIADLQRPDCLLDR